MKIDSVVIEDVKSGKYFAFIRQFPAICAQGDSVHDAGSKVNAYFKAFIEKMRNQEVSMDDSQITSV